MPYFFKAGSVNVIFIHIPKTGGTSIEDYFYKKYNVPKNETSLYSGYIKRHGVSLQHQSYQDIMNDRNVTIHPENLQVIAAVRHPYERVISDLFYFNLIEANMTSDEVEPILIDFITSNKNKFDGHNRPQWTFVASKDDTDAIDNDIVILRHESLHRDMHDCGFTDFDVRTNVNKKKHEPYVSYLTEHAINELNRVYAKDFVWFHYAQTIVGETKPKPTKPVVPKPVVPKPVVPKPAAPYAAKHLDPHKHNLLCDAHVPVPAKPVPVPVKHVPVPVKPVPELARLVATTHVPAPAPKKLSLPPNVPPQVRLRPLPSRHNPMLKPLPSRHTPAQPMVLTSARALINAQTKFSK